MGTGWRRALCTSVQRDDGDHHRDAKNKKRRPHDAPSSGGGGFFFLFPSRFALLKASLLPSKARCGVCSRGVKSGGSSAVFTAECSHALHFPCIATHARSSSANGVLSCPVHGPSLSVGRRRREEGEEERKVASCNYRVPRRRTASSSALDGRHRATCGSGGSGAGGAGGSSAGGAGGSGGRGAYTGQFTGHCCN